VGNAGYIHACVGEGSINRNRLNSNISSKETLFIRRMGVGFRDGSLLEGLEARALTFEKGDGFV
jgi:hypothetical protein